VGCMLLDMSPRLAVAVLNRYDLLRRMLESIAAGSQWPAAILILDNGGLLETTHEALPLDELITVSGATEPRSVAASWNDAIRWAQGPLVITNDDIVWGPDAFRAMARALRYGEPDIVTSENVGGFACFGLSRELVENVGYLDERFAPAYFEDEDYRYRMRLKGFELRNVPGCTITHVRSATVQMLAEPERQMLAMRYKQNLALYRQKWGGVVGQETCREAQI